MTYEEIRIALEEKKKVYFKEINCEDAFRLIRDGYIEHLSIGYNKWDLYVININYIPKEFIDINLVFHNLSSEYFSNSMKEIDKKNDYYFKLDGIFYKLIFDLVESE